MKKHTMPDGKTRAASEGPWVAFEKVEAFLDFCDANGHATRAHPDPFIIAYQVKHQGRWMSVIWNKNFNRYTVDRRLSLVVQSFATDQQTAS